MGLGIAHVLAVSGRAVTVVEPNPPTRTAATGHLERSLERAAADDPAVDVQRLLDRVALVSTISAIDPATVLVVEAVPEVRELKTEVLCEIEATVGPTCVIASNTSSIAIATLAAPLVQPSRFLGMHFFNPVPSSSLVELVTGPATSDETVASASDVVQQLGKTAIVVQDSPGFATSRLGVLLGLEAIRMLEEGVATAEAIDTAMTLGYRHAMGPLRSTDLVGLDVRLAIAEYLSTSLGPRFAPPELLRDKVRRGELGRKTGRGFYTWE